MKLVKELNISGTLVDRNQLERHLEKIASNHILRLEALQAFENRKARAKKLGEEAGTKLLIPMFIMFAVVLVMIMIPAFLTMQI